ncbi:terminase family protein [Saccharomonospora azurea]|uniref:terminase large subunit domain-containing protein n=1 Tax=Saccharomonospora azurea TaxID=40988 RepID=UPI00331C71AC
MTEAPLSPEYEAQIEEQHRQEAERRLTDPLSTATFLDYRGVVERPHLRLISDEIGRIATGHTDRLQIQCPPQVGKSLLAAVWAPFWWLARNPSDKVIVASYGNALAVTRGKQIRKLVQRYGWRYGLELEPGSSAVNDWSLRTGGGVRSAGVGGALTGFPGDVGCVDDSLKSRAEAESRIVRERIWDWYSADFLSRLSPGAPIIMIGTPWHEDDLLQRVLKQDGRVEEGGRWRVVKLPALADVDDPLGREPGAPLSHPKIPVDDTAAMRHFWQQRRKETSARDWVSLYLCDPKPMTEALVSHTLLRERTHLPPPVEPKITAVGVDPSGGGRDMAGIVGGFLGTDDRVYITHDASMVGPSAKWARAVVYLAAEIDADVIVFESNFGGDMAETIIKAAWKTARDKHPGDKRFARVAPRVKSERARKGKLLRADPIAGEFEDDRLRLGAKLPELVDEWVTWRPTDTDSPGRIDASVYLAYHLLPVRNESAEVVQHPAAAPAADPFAERFGYGFLSPGARVFRGPPGRTR